MKIFIVIHSMASGGAERVTALLSNFWAAAGHDIHVITLSDQPDSFPLHDSVHRVRLKLDRPSTGLRSALSSNIDRISSIRRLIHHHRPDVVIGMMTQTGIHCILAAIGSGTRVYVSERSFPPALPLGRAWEALRKVTYPFANSVIMLTSEGQSWLNAHIPRANGKIIPNCVQFPLPPGPRKIAVEDHVTSGRRLLLAVGRLDADKQFDQLIDVFSRVSKRQQEWVLAILGDGPLRQHLSARVETLGLTDRVLMPGSAGNIADWYNRADLFVMTSRLEGFPNVLIEAMSHGCCVISYDCDTGPRDIITNGEDGLLIKPVGNVAALEQAVTHAMTDENFRERLGKSATNVTDRFSAKKILSTWTSLIEHPHSDAQHHAE